MKGYSKGVNFHTSANKAFGRDTKPSAVTISAHVRGMPKKAPRGAVGGVSSGSVVCDPVDMKNVAQAAVRAHVAAPAPKGHKGLKK